MIRERLPFVDGPSEWPDEHADGIDVEHEPDGEPFESVPEIHRSVVAPSAIERERDAVRTAERRVQTQWITEFPDAPVDGLFEDLYAAPEARRTDSSLHLEPRDTHAKLDELETRLGRTVNRFNTWTPVERISVPDVVPQRPVVP
jgi:hypothetical protein